MTGDNMGVLHIMYCEPCDAMLTNALDLRSAVDSVLTVSIEMPIFKKYKKSRQPSQQPMSPGIPTQIAIGALGMDLELEQEGRRVRG